MTTIRDDGERRPSTRDRVEDQSDGDGQSTASGRPESADKIAENAIRLDEIETLLHELSTEFEPAKPQSASSAPAGGANHGAKLAPESRYQRVELPPVSSFDLGKPVDYDQDPTKYDSRRASVSMQSETPTPQAMARKLAPKDAIVSPGPRPDQSTDQDWAQSANVQENETDPDATRPSRRRLRLRPARRVAGSRPEPRPGYPDRDVEAAAWNPRLLDQSGKNGAIYGAGLTVLLLTGAVITFVFLEPARGILPDRMANVFDNVSRGLEADSGDNSSEGGLPNDGTFQVASAETGITVGQTDDNLVQPAVRTETAAISDQVNPETEIDQADKSADRVDQDSVVQAISKDPEKRALDSKNGETWIVRQRIDDAEPTVTGSIGKPASGEATSTVTVSRQASAKSTETAEPKKTGSASVAGLGSSTSSSNNVSAYAPSVASVQNDVPFPNTTQPAVKPNIAPVVKKDAPAPTPSQIDVLLKRGNSLLQLGDIASARLIFNRVAVMGDERGAKGMGMTYDPEVYRSLPVAGMAPDQAKADYWYSKAKELADHKRIPDAAPADAMSVVKN